MGDMTANFSRHDFDCKDGTPTPPEFQANLELLVKNLQAFRDKIGLPVIVICGYRTLAYNTKCEGKPKSEHLEALAADIMVKGWSTGELHEALKAAMADGTMYNGGLGYYHSAKNQFCHYDCGGKGRRWEIV